MNKPVDARRSAFFNIFFNVIGSLILFLPLSLYSGEVATAFCKFSGGIERQIANFHTLFNLFTTLLLLPLLKPITKLVCLIVNDKSGKKTLKPSFKRVKVAKT